MRIGELARRTGISARMLRYYEEQGLITPQRGDNGYRDYDETLVERAEKIRCFLDASIPMRVIAAMLDRIEHAHNMDPETTSQLRAMLVRERDRLAGRIDSFERNKAALTDLIHTLDGEEAQTTTQA
ncbi:MerR family transcriptional regulator [Streptomyces sp. NPDC101213]|uniref:MerR family transcriptional regulator n=1 Tax=Streptomyces sp. NPDC101213 TaxID=3366130 RepID=UPI003830E38A